ncbi:hypothetical protein B0H34DRAFT_467042 [Crassisporium funariophilum]|nr:hypothetical protein B0H34DRAFT_467042 [Crassisporium funariophilum]
MAQSTRPTPLSKGSRLPPPVSSAPRVRQRKPQSNLPSQAINTNLSAHVRTDPTSALSALLKLITSLPTRIGGCQYKFTQSEHALSLHLISIIDPFVYHGVRALASNVTSNAPCAPAVSLVNQPTEILDAIMFHVDSRKDLLNVALGCKRLHDVIFPRHFEYRVIRCKVSSISVWNHLVLHRSLARNVRKLEILDERAPSGPGIMVPRGILQGDTDLESTDDELSMHLKQERFLAAALVRMTGLRDFKWSCNHSPISIAHVWPTLMTRAAHLKSMEICDNLVFAPRIEGGDDKRDDQTESEEESDTDNGGKGMMTRVPARMLSEMTSITFRSTPHSYGAAKQPELTRISSMLHRCLNIKDLEITYIAPRSSSLPGHQVAASRTRPRADEFLMYSRWKNLTTLTLTNLRCTSSLAPSAFLSAHTALEVLHMDMNINTNNAVFSTPLQLPVGALPRLREIKATREIINTILECPCEPRRPLESVKGFKLSGNHLHAQSGSNVANSDDSHTLSDIRFLSNLQSSTIRRVEMTGWHDMEDVKKLATCIPSVQHLDVGRKLGTAAHKSVAGPATNMVEWADLLGTLPELTTMYGVRFFYEVSSVAMAGSLSTLAPSALTSTPATSSQASGLASTTRDVNPVLHMSVPPSGGKASQLQISMMERSRMRKNDEIAAVLAWKCKKLRRVDHWDENSAKVVVLLRDQEHGHARGEDDGKERAGKVRWEVRRIKH